MAAAAVALVAGCGKKTPEVSGLYVDGTVLRYADTDSAAVLKGVSLGWHNIWPRFYNGEAVKALAQDWGVQVVRAAIGADNHAKADNPQCHSGFTGDREFALQHLYEVADAAVEAGIYVIADWHSHKLMPEEAKSFFTEVATRYKDCPNVIYELYNEPVDDSWEDLKAYAEDLISVITGISTVHPLILMGCPHWDQDIHLPAADPIKSYDNVMYTVHFYAATHGQWLQERTAQALSDGLPVFISECGGCEASGDGFLDEESWHGWYTWAEEHEVSVVTWSISDKAETCSMLTPEATDGGPWPEEVVKPWGKSVREWLEDSNK